MDVCMLLVEDPELSEAVAPPRREQAVGELVAPVLAARPGPWTPPQPPDQETLGLLVLEGLLIRHIDIGGRLGLELLGETDLLQPWQSNDAATLPLRSQWTVLAPTRLALLDARVSHELARHPALMVRLLERALRRSRQLVANMAIVHQPRVDTRLALLLWQLANRWGRVRRDGVLVPVKLTHALLADLVAARRPTVTSALSDLNRRGVVRQIEEGWLLLGPPPAAGIDDSAHVHADHPLGAHRDHSASGNHSLEPLSPQDLFAAILRT
jgi:CRP/FNR family cyclic AMP-dependent transcriptional regulator